MIFLAYGLRNSYAGSFPWTRSGAFASNSWGFRPEVTLPHFGSDPRLVIMDVTPPSSFGGEVFSNAPKDPRLQPTPDFGTLGPGSDVTPYGQPAQQPQPSKSALKFIHLFAALIGMITAMVAGGIGLIRPSSPSQAQRHQSAAPKDLRQIDGMMPQKQAEALLEMAVAHSDAAVEQISARSGWWRGQIQWNQQIASLSTAALNSNDMRIRQSGVEVELAAYGLAKNSASLDYLVQTADSPDHQQKIWALWALGLMGNRGVETGRVVETLTSHLKDSDVDSRRWAVEGMALTGSDSTIQPLLNAMHDDPSPLVRERAACSLAESGLFTPDQRMTAVPQLLDYTDDPALDAQTHGWAFQALGDISHQHLPNDSAAWRRWYESAKSE